MVRLAPLLLALAVKCMHSGLLRPSTLFSAAVAVLLRRRSWSYLERRNPPALVAFLIEFLLSLLQLELAEQLVWYYITVFVRRKLPAIAVKLQDLGFKWCKEDLYYAGTSFHQFVTAPHADSFLLYLIGVAILWATLSAHQADFRPWRQVRDWATRASGNAREWLGDLQRGGAPESVQFIEITIEDDYECTVCEE
ncbi:hypothetical protein PR048_000284 [Dryococelus australis]|uniref:Uncharacterized protein n=1 Tax=Dryococelus australis TaxID=614101 RepID=A0ABQ9IED7_9NEOP|nr:hypothetical protein PR048_000284 [Dryococelus australis]